MEKVATINVNRTVHAIMERSPILKEMIERGEIGIVGGKHDITTGQVTFFDDTIIGNFLKPLRHFLCKLFVVARQRLV